MAEEIGFENGRNSNFQGLVNLTLTLDPVIRHTVVHHSSTSTYIPNFIEIEETFGGRTDGRTFFPPLILLGRLLEVDLKMPWCALLTAVKNYNKGLEKLQDFFFKNETKTKTKTFIYVLETETLVLRTTSLIASHHWPGPASPSLSACVYC